MLKIKTESNSFPVLPIDTSAPLKLMKDRETLIFSGLKEVEEKTQEVEKEAESYRQKKEELYSEHEELLIKAKEGAKNFKADLIKEAREEIEASKAEWYKEVLREIDEFLEDLRTHIGEQIYAICGPLFRYCDGRVLHGKRARRINSI